VPSRFYRRPWDQTRGDDFDSWGRSVWYFETSNDGWPVRQIEVYDGGRVLRYGPDATKTATAVSAKRVSTTQVTTGVVSKSPLPSFSVPGTRPAIERPPFRGDGGRS
jgi:hypothetical protein